MPPTFRRLRTKICQVTPYVFFLFPSLLHHHSPQRSPPPTVAFPSLALLSTHHPSLRKYSRRRSTSQSKFLPEYTAGLMLFSTEINTPELLPCSSLLFYAPAHSVTFVPRPKLRHPHKGNSGNHPWWALVELVLDESFLSKLLLTCT